MRIYAWLNNVSDMYLVQVSSLLIGDQVCDTSSGIDPCFPWAGGLCKIVCQSRRKITNTAPTTLSVHKLNSKCD